MLKAIWRYTPSDGGGLEAIVLYPLGGGLEALVLYPPRRGGGAQAKCYSAMKLEVYFTTNRECATEIR